MAAQNGMSSSATSTSSAEGTTTVTSTQSTSGAGGEPAATGAPNVWVGGSSSKADGAGNRGNYRLNGYTLEVTFDNGRKGRTIAFPWGEPWGKYIWLWGRTYANEAVK